MISTYRAAWTTSPAGDTSLDTRRAWVEVDLSALHHNLQILLQRLSVGTEIWAIVKANAYGHGAQLIAPAALSAGASGICVATLSEGIELRHSGITAPILILGPLNTGIELNEALRWSLEVTLTHPNQIPLYQQVANLRHCQIPIHLNVDTGMTRIGVPWHQAAEIWSVLQQQPCFHCQSLYSHFATADEIDSPIVPLQQQRLEQVLQAIEDKTGTQPIVHMDNSAAALARQSAHFQRVRIGLALYGISPADHLNLDTLLRPVLNVKARITHLQTIPSGTGISYGYHYIADSTRQIATVAIGYADGIPRRLSNWLQGYVNGQQIQQVGAITMDQCMWDVTCCDVQVGDVVELLQPLSIQAWADQLGTIPYEVLCGLSARLPRLGIESSAHSIDR